MDVSEALRTRRSIRKYLDREIEEDKLMKVLEAARISPSAKNLQSWKFIAVRDPETRRKLAAECVGQAFTESTPAFIVCCGTDPEGVMSCGQPRHTVDLSIASAYMMLQAHELGLGSCWLGRFDEQKARDILGIPADIRVPVIFTLGYPDEQPAMRPRKDISELVCFDKYY